jgi:coatomer subunit beta
MDLVTTRTIEEMIQLLKKEVIRILGDEQEDAGKYKQLLVKTLHACSIKFPDVAATVIPVLIEFLSGNSEAVAKDVLVFIREAIQTFDNLKPLIIEKLLDVNVDKAILYLSDVPLSFNIKFNEYVYY